MIYEFGSYRLDADRLELWCGADPIAVEPQVFSLLLHLIENRERVVSKDELIDTVWRGRIVSDATLSTRINAARRAIGDDGRAQAVIRTAPHRGFRFVADVTAGAADKVEAMPAEPDAPGPALPDRPSIAVLPFVNLSGDAARDYFTDGICEDIIMALSNARSFFVIARNSSFTYKDRNVDVKTVGRELGVHYVLDGSVRIVGERARVGVAWNHRTSRQNPLGVPWVKAEFQKCRKTGNCCVRERAEAGVVGPGWRSLLRTR
ncbi:MAG: winged helix-turn-helix domain-containing protein [Magnetovibrio sp.]|nr:winged helix-turn-helix domain-containing protein [Magnetovibrio sp.]